MFIVCSIFHAPAGLIINRVWGITNSGAYDGAYWVYAVIVMRNKIIALEDDYIMKETICLLLATLLFCLLICAAELPAAQAAPRQRAWWGLICPTLFGIPEDAQHITFAWPVLTWLRNLLPMHA